ncbi:MAG: entericidin A/B family lipoprotein [Burkholderiales bacterium]
MRRLIYLVLLAATLAGCNTVQGLGKDLEQGGEALQRAGKK